VKKAGFFTPFFSLHSPAFTTASRSEGFRRNLRGPGGGRCHRGLCGGISPSRSEVFRSFKRGPGVLLRGDADKKVMAQPGRDKNGRKVPHLAGVPPPHCPLWPTPSPGRDKNTGKCPYLERTPPPHGSLCPAASPGGDKNTGKCPYLERTPPLSLSKSPNII
jgi:hypothetical protein